MANRYVGNIYVIDTTDTQLGGPNPTGGVKGNLYIRAIKWVSTSASAITNDADLTIEWKDSAGDIIIAARAVIHETAASSDLSNCVQYSVEFGGEPWIVPGLYFEDLDAGEVQIFLA